MTLATLTPAQVDDLRAIDARVDEARDPLDALRWELVRVLRERDALRDVLRDALRALLERHAGRWCGVCGQPTHAVDCVVGRAERLGVTP